MCGGGPWRDTGNTGGDEWFIVPVGEICLPQNCISFPWNQTANSLPYPTCRSLTWCRFSLYNVCTESKVFLRTWVLLPCLHFLIVPFSTHSHSIGAAHPVWVFEVGSGWSFALFFLCSQPSATLLSSLQGTPHPLQKTKTPWEDPVAFCHPSHPLTAAKTSALLTLCLCLSSCLQGSSHFGGFLVNFQRDSQVLTF